MTTKTFYHNTPASSMAESLENKSEDSTGPNILFGVTGSVAAIKTIDISKEILKQIEGANIKLSKVFLYLAAFTSHNFSIAIQNMHHQVSQTFH